MPLAARISDAHVCPVHGGPPIASGSADVLVGYLPAARVGDVLACAPPDVIVDGAPTVLINYRPAARMADPTAHGGKIAVGCPTVDIGESSQAFTLRAAAANGTPFCEECEKARRELEKQRAAREAQPPAGSAIVPSAITTSAPQVTLKDVTPHEVQIAKQPGSTPEQQAARKKVAAAFYAQMGIRYVRGAKGVTAMLTPPEIRSHLKGIDFTQPVSFGPPPPLPAQLQQWQMPGWDQGQYYAGSGVTPSELGIHHEGNTAAGAPTVAKVSSPYGMHAHGAYLKSTAAPINDTWSVKEQAHATKGGGTQYYVPNRAHAKAA
jgi:uncharacterized Zn-binding protein involved in type VI secretion